MTKCLNCCGVFLVKVDQGPVQETTSESAVDSMKGWSSIDPIFRTNEQGLIDEIPIFVSEATAKRLGKPDLLQRYARGTIEMLHRISCRAWNKSCVGRYNTKLAEHGTVPSGFSQLWRFLEQRLDIYKLGMTEFLETRNS